MNGFIRIDTENFGEMLIGIAHIENVYMDQEQTVIIATASKRSYRAIQSFDEIITRWDVALKEWK